MADAKQNNNDEMISESMYIEDDDIFEEGTKIMLVIDQGPETGKSTIRTKVIFSSTAEAYVMLKTRDHKNMEEMIKQQKMKAIKTGRQNRLQYKAKEIELRMLSLVWKKKELILILPPREEAHLRSCGKTREDIAELKKRWPPIEPAPKNMKTITLIRKEGKEEEMDKPN